MTTVFYDASRGIRAPGGIYIVRVQMFGFRYVESPRVCIGSTGRSLEANLSETVVVAVDDGETHKDGESDPGAVDEYTPSRSALVFWEDGGLLAVPRTDLSSPVPRPWFYIL